VTLLLLETRPRHISVSELN